MAPILAQSGQLFGRLEDFSIILYPYLPGKDGYEPPLTKHNWVELGLTLSKVHTTNLPASLASSIPHEA
jgi:spectinomycin phosphotransferase